MASLALFETFSLAVVIPARRRSRRAVPKCLPGKKSWPKFDILIVKTMFL
jgi:hypothetical protein